MEISTSDGSDDPASAVFDDVGLDEFQYPDATIDAATSSSPNAPRSGEPDEHDQLPNVDEYKASQGLSHSQSGTTRMKVMVVACSLVSMALLMVIVGLLVGSDDVGGTDPRHGKHTARATSMADFIAELGWTDNVEVHTPGTPQYQAVYWLAEVDEFKAEIGIIDQELMQRFVLATFYYSLGGPNWSHEVDWMSKSHSCKWNTFYRTHSQIPVDVGASCYGGDALRQIYLPSLNLRGDIPTEVGLLLDLTDFDLHKNKVDGILPEDMKNLHELKNIHMNENHLLGNLPLWISDLTNLKSLQLADNQMHGELPTTLSEMTQLTHLVLERNSFGGHIGSFQGLNQVRSLYLGGNSFGGSFNDTILWSKDQLEILDLSDNQFTGSLPVDLFSMKKLSVVDMHGNEFDGRLPPFASFDNQVRFLALQDNKLDGLIDHRLQSLTHLEHLDLSKNFFTGPMPTNLGHIKSLRYLFLAFNQFLDAGPVPVEFTKLPNLAELSLQKSNRNGKIPYEFTIESDVLVLLDLNSNHLTGTIPPELGSMEKLRFLLLKDNKLSGTVPTELAKLDSLHTLLLEDNDLTGAFDECTALSVLALVSADCNDLKSCKCCTKCCEGDCTEVTYFSDLDPLASSNYARETYNFVDDDPEYTVPTAQKPGFYENYEGYNPLAETIHGDP